MTIKPSLLRKELCASFPRSAGGEKPANGPGFHSVDLASPVHRAGAIYALRMSILGARYR